MRDGFDEVLIDGDEIRTVFIVDDHIREADEEALFFVDSVGDAVPHRRDEKIAHVHAIDSADANANLLPFWHGFLLPWPGMRLAFTTQKLLTPAQFFVLVFAHFLPAFFEHAGHTVSPFASVSLEFFSQNCKQREEWKA